MRSQKLVILMLLFAGLWVVAHKAAARASLQEPNVPTTTDLGYHSTHDRRAVDSLSTITRLSLGIGAVEANGDSEGGRLSADGYYAVFSSTASNLVASDTNNAMDVFLRAIDTGETTRLSVNSIGVQGNGDSFGGVISADGRFVAFISYATNLVPNDLNETCDSAGYPGGTSNCADVLIYDVLNDVIELVSLSTGGSQGNGASFLGDISADGRFVVFSSQATNLVPGDTNSTCQVSGAPGGPINCADVFVRDRLTGETSRVSVDTNGGQANGASGDPEISANGRYVVFDSYASNLVPIDGNGYVDVFVHDRQTNMTSIVSVSTSGGQGDFHSHDASISGDGRYVVFQSLADLAPAGVYWDIFLRDRTSGVTSLVSRQDLGYFLQGSFAPTISFDGRFVAFQALHDNPSPPYPNDIFILDRLSNQLDLISITPGGIPADDHSTDPHLSADGHRLVFQSAVSNLVPGDDNGKIDIFLADRSLGQATVVQQIPVTGGELESIAYHTTLSFPSGTFTETAQVTLTGYLPSKYPIPQPLAGIGHFFDLSAVYTSTGATASPMQPYTITIAYSDQELHTVIESTLSMVYWNGNQWVEEGNVIVDLNTNRIAATVQHFSSWAVLGETKHLFLPLITRGQ